LRTKIESQGGTDVWFKKSKPRVLVIGLDGTPLSFLKRKVGEGKLPNFKNLFAKGSLIETKSVHPTVSCVAWSTFMTGKNAAKHNIFGFIDRKPGTYSLYIPNSSNMTSKTMWEVLSDQGRKVLTMGVPVTYPPRKVNGILVSGFLAPKIDGATYPPAVASRLKQGGYELDIDPWRARENLDNCHPDLKRVFEARARNFMSLYKEDKYDFAIVHFMETDRLHHFMWEYMDKDDEKYGAQFMDIYAGIDEFIGRVDAEVGDDVNLFVMSDHGFCTLKKEIYINRFLEDRGYLVCKPDAKSLEDMDTSRTRVFCLDPGRIYINLEGREAAGIVKKGDYEALREEVRKELLDLCDEEGTRVVRGVLTREELYDGPNFEYAPDLVVNPVDGYDPKGAFGKDNLSGKGPIVGMHTYDDAMLFTRGLELKPEGAAVIDVTSTIFDVMQADRPSDMDGKSLLA
jgi:predicted AlkP superfamily phosphohydrolase/phosphomutase